MAKTSKRELWGRRLAAYERSGLSRRAWCVARGVNVHTLDYWRYRLRPTKAARSRSKALVPIVVKDVAAARSRSIASPAAIEIALPSGVRVQAPTSTDARWLAGLVRELGAC
ncbi:MAG: IS66 family insertion sequence element accessory protein TnpA [Luteimonas sp.]